MSQQQIHRQMTIEEILSSFPSKGQKLAQEITNSGLHCVGCHAATWETLEAGMRGHGFAEDAIDSLVKKLNDILFAPDTANHSTVQLTPEAAAKFLEFAAAEGKQGLALRFSDRMEGCSGFAYVMEFSEKAGMNDTVFTSHGIEIHVPNECLSRLVGSTIGYKSGLHSTGFTVDNPNAASTCGCGSSHGYSKESYSSAKKQGGGCCGSSKGGCC